MARALGVVPILLIIYYQTKVFALLKTMIPQRISILL